ncbi:MAG: methyltransferase domain-containing protein [Rhodospirillales bacterium]|jgi:predicted SAM-dependent methyltransferase|nr:methyltransferase domain-containing protein [Rhodospirillales bacterium]
MNDAQQPFDVAVIVPTMLRPSLDVAVRSIFAQDIEGRVQIMIGIDKAQGSRELLDALIADCPDNMCISVVDPGYSTSAPNGGLYNVLAGGSLRTALCYLANSTHIAFLDDDNWWAPNHLWSLLAAIQGFDWAFSLRWYVDPDTHEPLCVDEWESVGPGKGIYAEKFGGFVDTNTLMINKMACHWVLPAWCQALTNVGRGEDRTMFDRLRRHHSAAWSGEATSYYVYRRADYPLIDKLLAERGKEALQSAPPPAPRPKGKGGIVDHRIAEYLNSAKSPRLHLGAGAVFLEGWLNTDVNPHGADVVRLDATRPLPFQSGSFESILAERLIEHLEYRQTCFMLSECFRVLKPGGRVRIATPDLQRFFALYSRSPTKAQNAYMAWTTHHFISDAPEVHPTMVLNNLFRNFEHRFIFDADTLTKALRAAGFRDLKPFSMGQSDDPGLCGVTGRNEAATHEMLEFETMVWEGRKP